MSRNVKQGLSYSRGTRDNVFLITLSVTFQIFYNQLQYFPSHKNNRRKKINLKREKKSSSNFYSPGSMDSLGNSYREMKALLGGYLSLREELKVLFLWWEENTAWRESQTLSSNTYLLFLQLISGAGCRRTLGVRAMLATMTVRRAGCAGRHTAELTWSSQAPSGGGTVIVPVHSRSC